MEWLKVSSLVVIFFLLSGCLPQVAEREMPAYLPEATTTVFEKSTTPTVLTESTATPTRIMTPIPATETVIASATPFPFQLQTVCPSIGNVEDIPPGLTGTIVLSGEAFELQGQAFLPKNGHGTVLAFWNVETGDMKRYEPPEKELNLYYATSLERYYYYSTSLDHRWLAMTVGKLESVTTTLTILDQAGEEYDLSFLPDDWTMFRWVDDGLLIRRYRSRGEENGMVLYYPATDEYEELRRDFPELYYYPPLSDWGTFTVYNPQLTMVVYPSLAEENPTMNLWNNVIDQKVIRVALVNELTWSPHGNWLAFTDNTGLLWEEIFLLNNEGESHQATHLADIYNGYVIRMLSWSPNGRYLAFWVQKDFDPTDPFYLANLAILDINTGQMLEYCFQSSPFPWRFGDYTLGYAEWQVNGAAPIWSPDSQYLLIEGIDLDNDPFNKRQTYLVDTQKRTIAKIAEDARPVSWMASP